MAVSPALTSTERTRLAGPSTVLRYLSVVPETTVATARINQVSFTYPLTQLTVDGTSGGWSSVREGQTVYVGSAAGTRDRGTYRVRKAGNSTTLYLQELGMQDPGQVPVDIRTASFANDDYITVIDRLDLWSVLPRIDPDTGAIYEDYDLTVGTYNTTPQALVDVVINKRRNHLFDYISSATLAISATVTVKKWPTSSGSSLSYSWTVPGSWTSVSGTSSATLTATAAPGNYKLYVTVTDSIGGTTTREIVVNIHHPTLNAPILISEMPQSDTRDRQGRRLVLGLNNTRLASIPLGAMVGYFEVVTNNGADVDTITRQFVGWVQQQSRAGQDGLRDASVEIIGPAGVLGLLNIASQVIEAAATPTTWQQVVPSLSTAAFMCYYMLRWRVANVLRLFNLTVYDMEAAGQRQPQWELDKGTLLQQMQSLATERGNFGANSEGELFFLRHPSMVSYGDRGTDVVTRDTLTADLYSTVNITRRTMMQYEQVRGEGLSWDGSADLPTPYYSDAPKSPGQGASVIKLASQVVTDQDELNQLTGDFYAQVNNPYPQIDVKIQRNRDVYEPAEMAFVSLTVPSSL